MFKKLLVGGALATALIAGIGTASATELIAEIGPESAKLKPCPSQRVTLVRHDDKGPLYEKHVINPYNNFAVTYNKYEEDVGKKIKWELQRKTGQCLFKGPHKGFGAYYLGRVIW
ncbi:hypothetical protein BDD26_3092 [Xenorhabdus cabanillasii]|uniref:Uncharacterized protein n=1 Tax=Xenorhabdus cabanillasii TaxID=351673 RepID=A0A3D9UQH1_9GAMM|nr:hypothetical protein [Xenorhabdus cabanillasii]REF28214.1 hypothetical protein BDD26_3092 [Xenorhabdus cabanillasii]